MASTLSMALPIRARSDSMRLRERPASTRRPLESVSMYVALPELPLERTLSRKSVLYLPGCLIGGNRTRPDLSTPISGTLVDELALDDQALFVIRQSASLQGDERSAFFGFHYLDVVGIYGQLIGHAVSVLGPCRVLEQDLISLDQLIQVVEDQVRVRALVPEAMAGDVGVGLFLPGEARGRDVDGGFLELLLRDRIVDGNVLEAELGNGQGEGPVVRSARVSSEVEGLDGWYRSRRSVRGLRPARVRTLLVPVLVFRRRFLEVFLGEHVFGENGLHGLLVVGVRF